MKIHQLNRNNLEFEPFAPIPVGETVETDWAVWEDAVAGFEAAGNAKQLEVLPNDATISS
jgi:hypothetical protein